MVPIQVCFNHRSVEFSNPHTFAVMSTIKYSLYFTLLFGYWLQTPQGTVLVPLTHLMALQKQAAAVTQGTKSSTQDKDVQQIDGYPPLPAIQQGGKSEDSENMCSQQEVMFTLPTKFLEVDETFVQESPTKGNVLQCRKTKCARFPKPGDTVEFEVIEQLDGLPTCKNIKTKPRRGFIAQLDGGDSSSEEDSDLDDDSSEVCVCMCGTFVHCL